MVTELPKMTHTILNLIEFMERCKEAPLPIDICVLNEGAMNCKAYAKILYYKENEFIKEKYNKSLRSNTIESLISINIKLQQEETASGKYQKIK